jgi:AraC-like DNA-binding protein
MARADHDDKDVSPGFDLLPVREASDSEVQQDHGDEPFAQGDYAKIWRNGRLEGVELFRGSYRNYEFARHFHRVPAIGVVDRGFMSSYLRRGNHVLGAGTVLLLNPGEIHAPAPAGELGWGLRMFYLEEKLFAAASLNFASQTLRFQRPFVQDKELASNLFQLHLELEGDGDTLRFESLLLAIFSRLAERHSEAVGDFPEYKFDTARIDSARQYLEAHYKERIGVNELAEVSALSPSHFLRMFRDTTGLTPHAYLIQFRIEMATSLLSRGASFADVANATGFTDQSHFTRQLKRILGVTPGQYVAHSASR